MNSGKKLTLVLADDHGVIREGVAAYCLALPNVTVLAQCTDGEEATRTILELRPDFAIIDLNMPKMTGLEVIRAIRAVGGTTRLIVLSIDRNRPMIQELFRSGADGYVLKDGPIRHIVDAMNYISDGGKYTTPLLAAEMANASAPSEDPLANLSRREFQVFSFLVDGMRPRDIARVLDLSPKTVDTYRASIMRKLSVEGIAGLVKYAMSRNLPVKGSL
jgi:DNA-binding NarL/FixJ family response regulator